MARTKQTARGAKSNQPGRQAGMEQAVLAPAAPQQEEAPPGEVEAQEGAEEEVQAGTEDIEVVDPEEQVTAEQGPGDPAVQPSTSKAPTTPPSASVVSAEVRKYMEKCQGFAKTWFEEVVEKKEQAYRDLIASLVSQVEEQCKIKDLKIGIVGFSREEVDRVLESIDDTSGKYIDNVGRLQMEVSKEEEAIQWKRFTKGKEASQEQRALDEYYDAAKDLCHSQKVYMARIDKLSKVLDDPDRLLAIINHVQLPAVQVTVTTKEQDKKQAGLTGKEMVITVHLPMAEGWMMDRPADERMMAAWLYFVLYKQVTGSTAGQDKCAEKFGCSVTQFKRMITGKWQEGGKRKEDTKSVSSEAKKRKSERLEKIAQEEAGGKKPKRRRKAKVIHLKDADKEDED